MSDTSLLSEKFLLHTEEFSSFTDLPLRASAHFVSSSDLCSNFCRFRVVPLLKPQLIASEDHGSGTRNQKGGVR